MNTCLFTVFAEIEPDKAVSIVSRSAEFLVGKMPEDLHLGSVVGAGTGQREAVFVVQCQPALLALPHNGCKHSHITSRLQAP